MRLDPDCIRDVLQTVEGAGYNSIITLEQLHARLPDYDKSELHYTCMKLDEAGFLNLVAVNMGGVGLPLLAHINSLTYQGHEFLDKIRSDNMWGKVKSVAGDIGVYSVSGLSQIANGLITEIIRNYLNL